MVPRKTCNYDDTNNSGDLDKDNDTEEDVDGLDLKEDSVLDDLLEFEMEVAELSSDNP